MHLTGWRYGQRNCRDYSEGQRQDHDLTLRATSGDGTSWSRVLKRGYLARSARGEPSLGGRRAGSR